MGAPTIDVATITTFLGGPVLTAVTSVASSALIIYFTVKAYHYVRRAG